MDNAVVFGPYDHLLGVISQPDQSLVKGSQPEKPASGFSDTGVILLTAGMLHHTGPFGLHVGIARQLASLGIPSLRFDLSGIGESLPVGSAGRSIDRAAHEAGHAMDTMTELYGIKQFVLFGLCSGADDSMHAALQDPRITGFVAMDGCGYRTHRYYWHRIVSHYLPKACRIEKWNRWIRRWIHFDADAPESLRMGTDIREFPDREQASKQMKQLVKRGVQMHFVYTYGVAEYYNYANQFYEMFDDVDFQGLASTTYFPHIDHVALLCEDRNQMTDHVCKQIQRMVTPITGSSSEPLSGLPWTPLAPVSISNPSVMQ